jgi:gamma-glutamylcyclotransferase (GGCT)/AIG2-like uncharacterized protein YtfP
MKYAAYGMNTNLHSMAGRCLGARCLGPAVLPDHRFRFAHHADVIPDPGNGVYVVLWEITRSDLASLDRLEGWPTYYDRDWVPVRWQGQTIQALTYYMQPGCPDSPPSQSYWDMLTEGYAENGLPADQLYQALKHSKLNTERSYHHGIR